MKPIRLLVLVALALPAIAADLVVPPGGSIQAAIDAAVDGDRVLVQAATYAEAIDFRGKAIEVIGLQGPLLTTIDATGLDLPVVTMHQGEGPASRLRGFTITGGESVFGGGISALAGAIASPTVEDCILRGNRAISLGGGIAGDATMERCSVYGNTAAYGGGVYGAPTMRSCVLAANVATLGGGGLFVPEGATLALLEDTLIVENTATGTGKLSGSGGGVYLEPGASGVLSRCLVAANSALWTGGPAPVGGAIVIWSAGLSLFVDRCTIVGNAAGDWLWGGVYGPASLTSSIVGGNEGMQLTNVIGAEYCNVQGGWPGVGNIDADPLFVDPGPARDHHLEPGSPCIDAGDPAILDPDGSVADMGAFPFQDFYVRKNTTAALWSDPAWSRMSATVGGKVRYTIHSPADAGRLHLMLGSVSGTSPGIPFQGLLIPLVPDAWFAFTLASPGTPPLVGTLGFLDADGTAHPGIVAPPSALSGLVGLTAWHAAVAGDPATLTATLATNAETLEIVP